MYIYIYKQMYLQSLPLLYNSKWTPSLFVKPPNFRVRIIFESSPLKNPPYGGPVLSGFFVLWYNKQIEISVFCSTRVEFIKPQCCYMDCRPSIGEKTKNRSRSGRIFRIGRVRCGVFSFARRVPEEKKRQNRPGNLGSVARAVVVPFSSPCPENRARWPHYYPYWSSSLLFRFRMWGEGRDNEWDFSRPINATRFSRSSISESVAVEWRNDVSIHKYIFVRNFVVYVSYRGNRSFSRTVAIFSGFFFFPVNFLQTGDLRLAEGCVRACVNFAAPFLSPGPLTDRRARRISRSIFCI